MFNVGDKVICVRPESYGNRLKAGETYVIIQVTQRWFGEDLVYLEGFEQSCGGMYSNRFELATSVSHAGPDPSKPYPNPELEAVRQRQQELIDYKRKMRDYLYGTTNEEE